MAGGTFPTHLWTRKATFLHVQIPMSIVQAMAIVCQYMFGVTALTTVQAVGTRLTVTVTRAQASTGVVVPEACVCTLTMSVTDGLSVHSMTTNGSAT